MDTSIAIITILPGIALLVLLVAGAYGYARHRRLRLQYEQERRAQIARIEALEGDLIEAEEDQNSRNTEILKLKSALIEAQAARDDYIDMFQALPFPVWRRDSGSEIIWYNQNYADIAGTDQEDSNISELAPKRDPDSPRKLVAKARATNAIQIERRRLIVDGDRRFFDIHETPLEFDGQMIGFATDISREEELSAELGQHIAGHSDVLENLATAIAIYGPDQRLEFYNQAYAGLWRIEESFLNEKPSLAEVLDKQRELRRLPEQVDFKSYRDKRRAMFTNVLETFEELVQLPDETMLRTVTSPHAFGGLLFLFEDVTDKMALERARNTQIAVQRATLDNLYEGVAVFGSDARLKLFNSSYIELCGLDPEYIREDMHISDVVDHFNEIHNFDISGDLREKFIANVTRRDATSGRLDNYDEKVIDYNRVPLPDGNVLFTYVNVTDELKIQQALWERNEALEASDKMKSEFVANVSHELRTPLNTVIGFAEILVKQFFGSLNEKQMEYGEGILDSSNQLLVLINDILDLANIQAGKLALDTQPVNVHSMLANVVTLVHERVRERSLSVEFKVSPDIGWANLDERRIKQVIFNLIGNSIKFTGPEGTITLSATVDDAGLDISVADNGRGIPEYLKKDIFETFYKGVSRSQHSGTGLGLSLVKSFIELHQGSVTLESEENIGTVVTCRLPASVLITSEQNFDEPRV